MATKTKTEVNEPVRVSLAEPRPGAGYDPLAPTGLPPQGGIDQNSLPVTVKSDHRLVEVDSNGVLPFLSVSQAAVGRHVADLKTTLAHIERELEVTSPFSMTGGVNQHALDRINGLRETAERIRAEIDAIASWDDHQVRLWAKNAGYR